MVRVDKNFYVDKHYIPPRKTEKHNILFNSPYPIYLIDNLAVPFKYRGNPVQAIPPKPSLFILSLSVDDLTAEKEHGKGHGGLLGLEDALLQSGLDGLAQSAEIFVAAHRYALALELVVDSA